MTEESSILFQATLGERHQTEICADQGADASILDSTILDSILDSGEDTSIIPLPKPRTFNMAATHVDGKPTQLVCEKVAVVDTTINVRHGNTLIVRSLKWLVTTRKQSTPRSSAARFSNLLASFADQY